MMIASAESEFRMLLCGLETYLCPRTVLLKEGAEHMPFAS
jgi:hypothetical protein